MGGRGRLVSVLATASLPKNLTQVVAHIADPANDRDSLARVCALAGVPLTTVMRVFQEAVRARGTLLAHMRIAELAPDVAAAVMGDAIPGIRACAGCLGARQVSAPTAEDPDALVDCPACGGKGVKYHSPDHDVQKTALKISGLLEKQAPGGGAANIKILNQQITSGEASGQYGSLMSKLDDMLYGSGRERLSRGRAEQASAPVEGELADD